MRENEKNINFNNASLKISAGFLHQIPNDKPHIVFSGRSNVGKSSLINKLVNRNKLARTSSAPGKTITINFYDIDGAFYFVDLPGYGYAKRSEAEKKKWSELVEGYFKSKTDILAVLQLIDLKVGATKDDIIMFEYMNGAGLPYAVAATKADKLNKTDREKNFRNLRENKTIGKDCEIIAFSTLTGEGVKELQSLIVSTFEEKTGLQ
jgi:GTP-binding protein